MLDLDDLLQKTSRTFALAIPLLPEPTRRAVSVAYLLFRIADTFEDATDWPQAQRLEALEEFSDVLASPDPVAAARAAMARWQTPPPVTHAGYLELLRCTPEVVATLGEMPAALRAILVKHAVRTSDGMASVVSRADARGNLRLTSLTDLTDYCYLVAGIVGELLTDVFLHDTPSLESEAAELSACMVRFGEGLQLVNILKDSDDDARDGRVYLPPNVTRAEVLALARRDLGEANRYVQALQRGGAPAGYLGFTGLSLMLAYATLTRLEAQGPGAKVSRAEVGSLFAALNEAIASGAPLDVAASVTRTLPAP